MLDTGTTAPHFELPDETGTRKKLEEFKGSWIVIYFYPKDDTPGCTKEACKIRDLYDDFAKNNIVVLGVSKDSPSSHAKFKEKYQLPFTLLSDESAIMIKSYGALQEKTMFGKKYFGIGRITYIINPAGAIAKSYSKVSPAEHAPQLIKDIKELRTGYKD